jgi:hypothetical protein
METEMGLSKEQAESRLHGNDLLNADFIMKNIDYKLHEIVEISDHSSSKHRRCKDGSLDMRYPENKGLDKNIAMNPLINEFKMILE